jgi:stage III sporulation protein AG
MFQILKKIEQKLGGGPGGEKKVNTFRWLMLIGLIGAALMILQSYINVKEVEPLHRDRASPVDAQGQEAFMGKEEPTSPFRKYEIEYESRLKEMLEKVVGVGTVDVFVTVASTEEIVYARNARDTQQTTNETDNQGAKRHITEVSRSGEIVLHQVSGSDKPIIVKTIKPKVAGVTVVANGAENLTVRKLLINAVTVGLDVPPHRVEVVPRKSQ